MIDNKGKLFGKINIIDLLIIVIVIAGVAGLGYKFAASGTSSPFSKQDTIEIKFYAEEVGEFITSGMKVGDMVKDRSTNAYFGKITDIKVDKAASFAPDSEGNYVKSSKPGYVSVVLTVEGTGIYRDGASGQGASFDSSDYHVFKSTEIIAGNSVFTAAVLWRLLSGVFQLCLGALSKTAAHGAL